MKISKFTFTLVCLFAMTIANMQVKAQGNECTGAVNLPNLTKYCSNPKQFTNLGSTPAANGLGIPTCWPATATYDVWFKFTAIGTDVQTLRCTAEPAVVPYSHRLVQPVEPLMSYHFTKDHLYREPFTW